MSSSPFIDAPSASVLVDGETWRVDLEHRADSAILSVSSSEPKEEVVDSPLSDAVFWLRDLDARVSSEVRSGGIVRRELMFSDPPPLPATRPGFGIEDYRRLRQPAAQLIRPRLKRDIERKELFPYQRHGVDWLMSRTAGILADDMGLGKTMQSIVAARSLIASGKLRWALVVCPRSLLATWEEEFSKWAPELSRVRLVPQASAREEAWAAILGRVHVVITTYEQMRRPPKVIRRQEVPLLIVDEAHRIRNADAKATTGIRELHAERFWALTGTPVERDAVDLATLLSMVDRKRFAPSDAKLPISVLRARARPLVLRRRKEEVLEELPEVLERDEILELEPEQRRSYNDELKRVSKSKYSPDDTLRLLNELRRICDYDPETLRSSKLDRIGEILQNVQESGEKAVVFSTTVRPLELLQGRLSSTDLLSRYISGKSSTEEREAAIRSLRCDPDVTALLATTWVAGEGLTLTEANHVIFLNEWWNPSTNAQARDRVVRIGQQRGVRVYRFYCRGTVEEALARVLSRKSDLFDGLVDQLSADYEPDASLIEQLFAELDGPVLG